MLILAHVAEPVFSPRASYAQGVGYDPERHGPRRIVGPGFHAKVYDAVKMIPKGRVSTYGEIAGYLGLRTAARQVGFALAALPDDRDDVPWHRVVNAAGKLAMRGDGEPSGEQFERLSAEGITIRPSGTIDGFRTRLHRFDQSG